MWSDWKLRVAEMENKAKFFDLEGYSETAKWIRYFEEKMSQKTPTASLVADLEDALTTFKSEFRSGSAFRDKLIRTVEPILKFMVTKLGKQQLKFLPVFEDLSRSAQNLLPIGNAFKKFDPGKERFYGMCLVYLTNAEGIFDNAVRLLYGLQLESLSKPIDIVELSRLDVAKVKEEFSKLANVDVLFEGWKDGHVRNSIAHCRYYYDEKTNAMHFEDVNPWTGKQTYSESFTIEEFSELSLKLEDVWHLFSHLIFMWRIVHLVLYPTVPDAGKKIPGLP